MVVRSVLQRFTDMYVIMKCRNQEETRRHIYSTSGRDTVSLVPRPSHAAHAKEGLALLSHMDYVYCVIAHDDHVITTHGSLPFYGRGGWNPSREKVEVT